MNKGNRAHGPDNVTWQFVCNLGSAAGTIYRAVGELLLAGKPVTLGGVYEAHLAMEGEHRSRSRVSRHLTSISRPPRSWLRNHNGTYSPTAAAIAAGMPKGPTKAPGKQRGTRKPNRAPKVDTAGYVEAKRSKREAFFFSRNQALVAAAKRRYGYVCQVCRFSFLEQYGERGKDYIECHHLDPLADQPAQKWTDRITTIDRVRVLCANCHRMVHHGRT